MQLELFWNREHQPQARLSRQADFYADSVNKSTQAINIQAVLGMEGSPVRHVRTMLEDAILVLDIRANNLIPCLLAVFF